jgi:hypothetical protein
MDAMNQAKAAYQTRDVPRSDPSIDKSLTSLNELKNRLGDTASRLENLMIRLTGPRPPSTGQSAEQGKLTGIPSGHMNRLGQGCEECHALMVAIEGHLSQIEGLI